MKLSECLQSTQNSKIVSITKFKTILIIDYVYQTNSNENITTKIVTEGELLFTGPMIDHAMLYTKETEILVAVQ